MAGDEPPYLPVGTDVSAKYRGAFCEAKVKKLVKSVKCKVTLKDLSGSVIVTDDNIVKGSLKLGVTVEIKHPDSGHLVEGVIAKLTDSSMYTVVFDDADERTLRRTQLCLKGEKHFIESETLDNLPLSNPEHFGTPVMQHSKDKKKRRSLREEEESEASSSENDPPPPKRPSYRGKAQELVGKVMYIEVGDKKKLTAVPVLVALSDAHATELRTKDHLLVRSFKDSKYLSVSKRELKEFVREVALKNEDKGMKSAMEKALLYFDSGELPTSWNKEELLGSETEVEDGHSDDSSDDEPSEEKDRFVAQLYKFMDDRGTPINKGPSIGSKDLNLYKLFKVVQNIGGYNRVTNTMRWRLVYSKMNLLPSNNASSQIKNAYKKYLHAFEDFYRKLGSTMGTISRPGRSRHNSGRSLFRDRDKEIILSPKDKSARRDESKKKAADKSKGKDTPDKPGQPTEWKSEVVLDTDNIDFKKVLDSVKRELAIADSFKRESDTSKEDKSTEKNESRERRDLRKGAQKDEDDKDKREEKREVIGEEVLKLATRKRVKTAAAMQGRKSPRAEDVKREEDKEEQIDSANKEDIKEDRKDGAEKKDVSQDLADRKDTRRKTKDKETKPMAEEKEDSEESEKAVSDIDEGNELPAGTKLKVKYGRGRNHKIYEAKIVEWSTEDGSLQYLVHYAGWNNRYDEWVKPDRIVGIVDKPDSTKKVNKTKQPQVQAPKSPKGQPVTPTQTKKRGRPSLTPNRSTSMDVKPHKSRSPAPSGSSKNKARRTRRSSGYTESDVQSHASESEDSDLYLDDQGKEEDLLSSEDTFKFSRMSDTDNKSEITKATVPCFVEIQKERAGSSTGSPARKTPDHDTTKTDIKQEIADKSAEKTEVTAISSSNKDISKEKKMEEVKAKKSVAPLAHKEPPISGSKEKGQSTDITKHVAMSQKKETPRFLPTFDAVEEPIGKTESRFLAKTPVKFELHEKHSTETLGKVGALNESSDTSLNESPSKTESTSDDDGFSKVPDIVSKGEAEINTERVGELDLDNPPILVKAVSLSEVPAMQDKADTKTRGKKRESKEGGKPRGRPPSIHHEPVVQAVQENKPEIVAVKCTDKRAHQEVETHKVEPSPKKEKKENTAEKVTEEKSEVSGMKIKDENEKKKVKKKLKKKLSEERLEQELDKEKDDSKKEDGPKKSKDGNKKDKSAKKEKKAKKKKNKDADSEKAKGIIASQTPADSLVKLIANVLGETSEVTGTADNSESLMASSAVASLLTMSSTPVPSTSTTCSSSSTLPSAIHESKLSSAPQSSDILSRTPLAVQPAHPYPAQPQPQAQPSVSSVLLENTPPTTPEHEPDEVNEPPPDHLQLSIDRAVSRSMAEAVLVAESAIAGRLPPGGESPCEGEGSTTSNESGSSGNLPSSESSLDMQSSTSKRKRDADELSPKKKKRTSKRQEKKMLTKQNGSDSEEAVGRVHIQSTSSTDVMASISSPVRSFTSTFERRPRSPRTPKYNFNLEEGHHLEGDKRISFLVEKICEIRKIYMSLKSEMAGIDRRRKRHKRKERESSQVSTVTEVECS